MQTVRFQGVHRLGLVHRPQRIHGLLNGGGNGLLGGSAPVQTDAEGAVGFPVLLQIRTHLHLHTELEGGQEPGAELAHPFSWLFRGHLVDDGQNVLHREWSAAVEKPDGVVRQFNPHPDGPARYAEVPGILQQFRGPAAGLEFIELIADMVHPLQNLCRYALLVDLADSLVD